MYLIMIAGYKLIKKSKRVAPATADLVTGKARIGMSPIPSISPIDLDEAEYLAKEAANPPKNAVSFPRPCVSNRISGIVLLLGYSRVNTTSLIGVTYLLSAVGCTFWFFIAEFIKHV